MAQPLSIDEVKGSSDKTRYLSAVNGMQGEGVQEQKVKVARKNENGRCVRTKVKVKGVREQKRKERQSWTDKSPDYLDSPFNSF